MGTSMFRGEMFASNYQIKSDFVSMVSHEVRGPLNSVLMQQQVILDELAGEITPKQRDILQLFCG